MAAGGALRSGALHPDDVHRGDALRLTAYYLPYTLLLSAYY